MKADISKYLTQQVMTASPAKLISMLYDKTILSLREVISSVEANEIEARWQANARATEIITHMWSNLDKERGGEIADNLESIFSFILARLPEVDLHNDPEPAREAIELLEPLAESWRELARNEGASDGGHLSVRSDAGGGTDQPSGLSAPISA